MQATLAMHFQDRPEWSLVELAERVRVPAAVVKRRLRFWVNNGLLTALPNNVYRVATEAAASAGACSFFLSPSLASNVLFSHPHSACCLGGERGGGGAAGKDDECIGGALGQGEGDRARHIAQLSRWPLGGADPPEPPPLLCRRRLSLPQERRGAERL